MPINRSREPKDKSQSIFQKCYIEEKWQMCQIIALKSYPQITKIEAWKVLLLAQIISRLDCAKNIFESLWWSSTNLVDFKNLKNFQQQKNIENFGFCHITIYEFTVGKNYK